jgi:tetratricopeptide (TPR) repeat protein
MLYDRRDIAVTTESAAAVAALDAAVTGLLAHRRDTGEHLATAIAADPELAAGHCLAGFGALLRGLKTLVPAARLSLAAARHALRHRGGTRRERQLCAALASWCDGEMGRCADLLGEALALEPLDAMTAKLDHTIRFMLGDAAGMRRHSAAILPAWRPDVPGYGFILGCHAFALEETGAFGAAERLGRRAVAAEPSDVWGHHAVAHVLHASGDTAAGKAWLDGARQRFGAVNNFAAHLAWHRALFCLARNERDEALSIYDEEIRTVRTDDYRDVANAASLLRRLELRGVAIEARWDELAAIAEQRIDDDALVFARLHYLMCLIGAKRRQSVAALYRSLLRDAGHGTQARLAADVGIPMADAQIAEATQAPGGIAPELRQRLTRLGGSHVQRDIFHLILDALAARPRPASPAPDCEAGLADAARCTLTAP